MIPNPTEVEETEVTGQLIDRIGQGYRYVLTMDRRARYWHVFAGSARIAEALCTLLDDDVFNIGDLHVRHNIAVPQTFLQSFFCQPVRQIDYRRRGLGAALLDQVLVHARECGCRKVTGIISIFDLEEFSELIAWYERFGFQYIPETPGTRVAGNLTLDINSLPDVSKIVA
ncbi:MAG TPA: GNAT family N-acetyltransferase [Lacunisphaera sp.]